MHSLCICMNVCMYAYVYVNAYSMCVFERCMYNNECVETLHVLCVYVNDVCVTKNVWRLCMFGIYVFQKSLCILKFVFFFIAISLT